MKKHLLYAAAFLFGASSFAQTGGPDTWGMTYANSNATGGPTFSWIELDTTMGGSGTWSTASGMDDGQEALIPIGFNFPFYGTNRDTLSIGSNGTVYFADFYLGLGSVCMPGAPNYSFVSDTAFIALFHDDLDPSSGGNIFYQNFGTYFVVEFSNVVEFGGTDGDSWEVILYANGNILMQFKDASAMMANTSYSTGIQGSPSIGLGYICNGTGNTMSDSLAILWTEPSSAISVNEFSNDSFTVYPNPNNGTFTIASNVDENVSIFVYDVQGRIVYSIEKQVNIGGANNVSLENVEKGIYLVNIVSAKGKFTQTIIVQ